MIEINQINLLVGGLIIILNIIPLIFKKPKYYSITLPLSLLIGAIRVLFIK